jgi:hypothetical protein
MITFIKNYPETLGGIIFSNNIEGEREFLGKKIYFKKLESITEFTDDLFNRN